MTITGLGPDTRVMRLSNRTFGTITPNTAYTLRKDSDYEMTLSHLATNQTENGPDYDWQAQIEGQPSTSVLASGVTHSDANRFRVIQNHWILDNEDGLLGRVNQGFYDTNHATGKSARLLKVDLDIDASDSEATKLNYTLPDSVPVNRATLWYGSDDLGWTKWDEKTGLTGSGFLSFDQSFIDLIGFEDPNPIDRDLKLELEIAGESLEFPVNADRIERMKTEVDLINGFWVDVGLRIFNHKIVERYHDMVYSVPVSGELRQLFSTFASIDLGSSDFTAGTEAHKHNPDGGPEEHMTFTDGSTIGASPNHVSWSLSSQRWIDTSSVTVNESICTNSGISVLTGLGPALEIYQTNKSVRVDID
jgi:hypothetical protein